MTGRPEPSPSHTRLATAVNHLQNALSKDLHRLANIAKVMIGPNERARSQYPGGGVEENGRE